MNEKILRVGRSPGDLFAGHQPSLHWFVRLVTDLLYKKPNILDEIKLELKEKRKIKH